MPVGASISPGAPVVGPLVQRGRHLLLRGAAGRGSRTRPGRARPGRPVRPAPRRSAPTLSAPRPVRAGRGRRGRCPASPAWTTAATSPCRCTRSCSTGSAADGKLAQQPPAWRVRHGGGDQVTQRLRPAAQLGGRGGKQPAEQHAVGGRVVPGQITGRHADRSREVRQPVRGRGRPHGQGQVIGVDVLARQPLQPFPVAGFGQQREIGGETVVGDDDVGAVGEREQRSERLGGRHRVRGVFGADPVGDDDPLVVGQFEPAGEWRRGGDPGPVGASADRPDLVDPLLGVRLCQPWCALPTRGRR